MLIFFVCVRGRERERRERALSFSLRSTELRCSDFVGPRIKVHRINEGYVWVTRTRDFTEESKDGNSENSKLSSLRGFLSLHLSSKR